MVWAAMCHEDRALALTLHLKTSSRSILGEKIPFVLTLSSRVRQQKSPSCNSVKIVNVDGLSPTCVYVTNMRICGCGVYAAYMRLRLALRPVQRYHYKNSFGSRTGFGRSLPQQEQNCATIWQNALFYTRLRMLDCATIPSHAI